MHPPSSMGLTIERDSLKVYTQSVQPALKIKINFDFQDDTIPVLLDCQAYTDDMKFISNLVEVPKERFFGSEGSYSEPSPQPSNERDTMYLRRYDDDRDFTTIHKTKDLMFICDEKILDYIEDLREKNANKDVILKFHLNVRLIKHGLRLREYNYVTRQKVLKMIAGKWSEALGDEILHIPIPIEHLNNIGHSFIQSDFSISKVSYKITASDWVNNFKTQLGLGTFLLIEIPHFVANLQHISTLNPVEQKLKDNLLSALALLPKIEKEIKNGEWEHVVEQSRIVVEQIKKDVTRLIKDVIINRTGMGEDNVKQFTMALDNLEGYFNGLHHPHGGFRGGKEDAYLCYMLITSLINLIARKFINYIDEKAKP
jgi:hypothetical protein